LLGGFVSSSGDESDHIAEALSLNKKKTITRPPPSSDLSVTRRQRTASRKEVAEIDDAITERVYFKRQPRKMSGAIVVFPG
jgi:hypothetical protein